MPVLIVIGLGGMLIRNRTLASLASSGLLVVIVWGKVASDIYTLPAEDSAVLLLQFMVVLLLMEASNSVLSFDEAWKRLRGKDDDISATARSRLIRWSSAQLLSLGRFVAAAFGLSIALLIFGSFVSVSTNQLAFSGILVLAAVVAILILLTYRREPRSRAI